MTPNGSQLSAIGDTPRFDYDQDVDVLYVSFAPGEKATAAVELNENILLRFNLPERRAVGLTLMDYSVLVQPTALGQRHFRLSGLSDLEPDLAELVLELLAAPPVNRILTVAAYSTPTNETIPIVAVENPVALAG